MRCSWSPRTMSRVVRRGRESMHSGLARLKRLMARLMWWLLARACLVASSLLLAQLSLRWLWREDMGSDHSPPACRPADVNGPRARRGGASDQRAPIGGAPAAYRPAMDPGRLQATLLGLDLSPKQRDLDGRSTFRLRRPPAAGFLIRQGLRLPG